MYNTGKANSLIELRKRGFNVPPFFVLNAFDKEDKIIAGINEILPGVEYFAVRSSAKNEDSKEKSYAGQFYSALGVSKEHLFEEFTKVVDSFCGKDGLVIIQEFIPSDKAGVVFSQVDKEKIVIDSTIGLCRPVVDGFACDEYVCDKNGHIIHKNISEAKDIQLFKNNKIISEKSFIESLTGDEIGQLASIARQIQKLFGCPQDIEWCIKSNVLYILQSRPITHDFKLRKEEYFFDSANIAESYSGIVLPLTFSYAQFVYEKAYMDLLIMSGASKKKVNAHEDIFRNLLGHFYGRMYYNMNNWYKMTAFIPGYRRNKNNLEAMITSNVKEEIDISIKPSLWLKFFYPIIAGTKILFFGITSRYFKLFVRGKIRRLQKYNFNELDYKECTSLFKELSNSLLHKWYITMENDFLVMTYLGFLRKIIDEETLQKNIVFQSTATKQVSAIADLSKKIQKKSDLWDAIKRGDADEFKRLILKNIEIEKALNKYLLEFGYRFANELKLESIGIEEDITKLFNVLKIYENYKYTDYKTKNISLSLPLYKRFLFFLTLREFKKHASKREEFRLLRSNAFGIIRHIFRRMGRLLADQEIIVDADDIFYLTLEEILNENTSNRESFKKNIGERKQQYSLYEKMSTPVHFSTKDGLTPEIIARESITHNNFVFGKPASSGIIRGKVKIFKDFSMPDKIDFDILVASHTDPGWTTIIALAKGLIIEHGGVLSHASIIARELKIPTVIGAANATDKLKDGQVVEIDGSTGVVKIIS
ncbi:MAG: PEP/pyruvate-binding domain-containing protein [Patescibacteria group bacterium]